jgi:Glycosyltransferase like family
VAALIAFGSSVSGAEAYRRYAEPGVRLAAEADSEIYAFAAVEPIARTYNLVLEAAATREGLEALVLVHPHTEIVDPQFCAKVRQVLADPQVGVIGCSGSTGVRSIAWWEGAVTSAPVIHRYEEHGGGELAAVSWAHRDPPPAEVETVDGQLLVLSPWVVRNVRFDEALVLGHGFDLDFCLQVRKQGRKVVVADLRVMHHRSLELVSDLEVWVQAHIRVAEKWDGALDGPTGDDAVWKWRARNAEARREAARAIAFSKALKLDARVLELERALAEKTESASWRLTAPLRELNRLRRNASERRRGG